MILVSSSPKLLPMIAKFPIATIEVRTSALNRLFYDGS
jgi:hypothetical protein